MMFRCHIEYLYCYDSALFLVTLLFVNPCGTTGYAHTPTHLLSHVTDQCNGAKFSWQLPRN